MNKTTTTTTTTTTTNKTKTIQQIGGYALMLAEGDVAFNLHSFVVALTFVPMVIEVLAAATATLVLMVNEVSPPTQLSV